MGCSICGITCNLVTETWTDEDGFVTEDTIDLCHDCVEVAEARYRDRVEFAYFHADD